MDFYKLRETPTKKSQITVGPNFLVGRSQDFMVRGKAFYAIWDDEKKLWTTDEFDVQRLVDDSIDAYIEDRKAHNSDATYVPLYLRDFRSSSWREYRNFVGLMPDTNKQLDSKLVFLNDTPKRTDYSSKRLPYDLDPEGSIEAYDELIGTLFAPEEREKLEWAVGSIFAGDSKDIQKFIIMYGEGGTGKSTFLNIVAKLFHGYHVAFDAKALTGNNNAFSSEVFKNDPLVGIQHDGDLSKIADNTRLNSIVSHEAMIINEKFKPAYTARANTFLFMGTNTPVKITDARSGVIRRLIDVYPTGERVPPKKYHTLMDRIGFELGAIAYHCLSVYNALGKNYYSTYRPTKMMFKTDVFFNFVEDSYFLFLDQDGTTLKQAYELYRKYCDDSGFQQRLPKYKFKDELFNYFARFETRSRAPSGKQGRNVYTGFLKDKFKPSKPSVEDAGPPVSLTIDSEKKLFDEMYQTAKAQYATRTGIPSGKWTDCKTTLSDLDTTKLHYVRVPINHIVIDFDLKDTSGKKSLDLNLEAAAAWPTTYAEFSKSGAGVHLHYIYDGDPRALANSYSDGIEIKVFTGLSSLRRKFTMSNGREIAHISTGLPTKPETGKKMVDLPSIRTERALKDLILRNLNKEIHPGTKPSIDFIHKIFEDAYASGLKYDLTTMRGAVLTFATKSTNQSDYCVGLVGRMKFASPDVEAVEVPIEPGSSNGGLVFYDIEVFPNLFLLVWKRRGPKNKTVAMINPTAEEIEPLLAMNLVGFNNRRYDNHILYARWLGYTNEQLFALSSRIVSGSRNGMFREAYGLSHADIYDFSSKKQSLKKFEIELGIHHLELGFEWDQPVPEEHWPKVVRYCENDVVATEAVFESREQDYIARLILTKLSGLTPNHTTAQHTAKIIFGNDRNHKDEFVYTDLSERFPGYTFDATRKPKSLYRDEDPSEGGYVYAEPGMYEDVAVLDVASEHPTSLIELNLFGDKYTPRFKQLLDSRLAIKGGDYGKAREILGSVFDEYLQDPTTAKELSYALKIVINIVYGLTSASFENAFNDRRNVDNIVAKRGALFMIDLKHFVQDASFKAIHLKTDSVKIPGITQEMIDKVLEFGQTYGYTFEHEETYAKFCLVNNAVYIAKKTDGSWTATGAQFAHPYVFKTLFSKEPLDFKDLCETKSVQTTMYLDFNQNLPDGEHSYVHVGKVGSFLPIMPGNGGGVLLRKKEDKYYAVTRTKGYLWMEAETVKNAGLEDAIDMRYYESLAAAAIKSISAFGDFESFST